MDNCVHVVLITPAGQLVQRDGPFDVNVGSEQVEPSLKSGLQVVAVFVEKKINDPSGPFWDEYSGRSQLAVQGTFDGICVCQHDVSPVATDIRETNFNGDIQPQRAVIAKLADSTMGKGANWDVYEGGDGALYQAKLDEARALVGLPGF